jgi:phosphoglycerate dehydrogenase-like enzyme
MKPLILFDPYPRQRRMFMTEAQWARLEAVARIVEAPPGERMDPAEIDRLLPEAAVVVGQTAMPAERVARAAELRAVINVEGNFQPDVDYAALAARAVPVLGIGQAFAQPVAEMALAMALDLARDISRADRDFRAGKEKYGYEGNREAFLLMGAPVGMIGFGNLGRALRPLLGPFRCPIKVYDPWLPSGYFTEHDVAPATLDDVLTTSRVIFVLAGATVDNEAMLGAKEFAAMAPGTVVVLMSRALVVDFEAMTASAASGHIRLATDVFPEEPFDKQHAIRGLDNVLLSAHRAGGMRAAYEAIGSMVTDDVELILKGLPPVRLQRAHPQTAGRMRSKPGRTYAAGTKL